MSWLKKFATKKSHKPPKHPTSLGIPPGIGVKPDANVRSEGALNLETDELDLTALVGRNDGHDSRIVPPSSGHQRSNTSAASASTPGHSAATCGWTLLPDDEIDVNVPDSDTPPRSPLECYKPATQSQRFWVFLHSEDIRRSGAR